MARTDVMTLIETLVYPTVGDIGKGVGYGI